MNKNSSARNIFKQSSTTFYISSLFFPKQKREDVFDLYAFVRVFDNFVDEIPQQVEEYHALKKDYSNCLKSNISKNLIIENFVKLQNRYKFLQSWIDVFFVSMELDIKPCHYAKFSDTEKYIYGSAEVIGLMMAKILDLPESSYPYAQKLGKAFQYMNMIRDISEDQTFGRSYIPSEFYQAFGMNDLSEQSAVHNKESFKKLIRQEIGRYYQILEEAKIGYQYIPAKYLIPIKSAVDMFNMTMDKIYENPLVVYKMKVKPNKFQALTYVIKNYITNA